MKKFRVTVDGQIFTVTVEELSGEPASPQFKPEISVETQSPVQKTAAEERPVFSSENGKPVPAPMPGSVIEVLVKAGDQVKEGDTVVILEAMKMENEITAPQSGTVVKILVKAGDTVNNGDILMVIA